jgi:hypothetical protein
MGLLAETSGATIIPMSAIRDLLERDEALDEALSQTDSLDFSMLKTKLSRDENITIEECNEIEDLYKKFLALNIRYPDRKICPTGPIDLFWHAHIVDTQAYENDCKFLFGHTLHHFPYFGMRGEQDMRDLDETFSASVDLFIRHFGIDPTRGDTDARSCRVQNCP